ncbi:hypothetical protein DYB26_004834 [Aphanomyces astaci]|uniref:Uncharacterized protein n=1 Tax=Aphanomyces astaci TaxID=112090 RepID=A0A397DAT5_APHAT|nr:hypothetical protein DYB38_002343 [Aphanomyces astaci]RHY94906.1 hypothetical protein DYB26_004834 [Aphanomyces astaci]RHZ17558.1 hypothetical protein DYB31_004334 [Aphanomyces astaci]
MRLQQIYVRHYPPGLRLSCRQSNGTCHHKSIDLVSLGPETNVRLLVSQLIEKESLLTKVHIHRLYDILHGLIDKQCLAQDMEYALARTIKAHMQPLTNVAISKHGTLVATASYDKTAKLIRLQGQEDKVVLRGHEGVVYCVALNTPYSSLAVTGSFDKTCRVWDTTTGMCKQVLTGHEGEVVSVGFNASGSRVGSCSMDCTATVWDVETGKAEFDLTGHAAEVACFAFDGSKSSSFMATGMGRTVMQVAFSRQGGRLVSAGADHTSRVWHAQTGECLQVLRGHEDQVFAAHFAYDGATVVTASKDNAVRVFTDESSG